MSLLDGVLAGVPDPRSAQGRLYPLRFVISLVAAGTAAAGHDSISAIAQWAADAPSDVLIGLGGQVDPFTGRVPTPGRKTIARVLAALDAPALQSGADAWTARAVDSADTEVVDTADDDGRADGQAACLPALAVDGKSVRGAAAGGAHRPHLLSAVTHTRPDGRGPIVITQAQIADKAGETTSVAAMLDRLDLAGTVVTADALFTQRHIAQYLTGRGADYLFTVKANQPKLLTAVSKALTGDPDQFAPEHVSTDRAHGRTERRAVRSKPIEKADGIDFPGATQIFRVRRDTGGLDGQRTRKEIAYCITSLDTQRAGAQALGDYTRGHWGIENGTHYTRDVTFGEDASTLRTGTAPQTMAIIRNLITTAMRLTGWTNLAQARRHFAHAAHRCLDLLTRPLKTDKP